MRCCCVSVKGEVCRTQGGFVQKPRFTRRSVYIVTCHGLRVGWEVPCLASSQLDVHRDSELSQIREEI